MKIMTILKYLSIPCLLVAIAVMLTGCANPGETKEESARRHDRVLENNWKLAGKDIDTFLMFNESARATDTLTRP